MSELAKQDIEEAVFRAIIRTLPAAIEASVAFRAMHVDSLPPGKSMREAVARIVVEALALPPSHKTVEDAIAAQQPKRKRGRPKKIGN